MERSGSGHPSCGAGGDKDTSHLDAPRRWLAKHTEELRNLLPMHRLKGLGLHRHDSAFTALSNDEVTQLVKEVMSANKSRNNTILDSTESLKVAISDSATNDFIHQQHVNARLKMLRASQGGDQGQDDDAKAEDLVSLLHITESAVTMIQRAFRRWREVWHELQPQQRARVRARYMMAVRRLKSQRAKAAAEAEERLRRAEQQRRRARDEEASRWLQEALRKAEEARLQLARDMAVEAAEAEEYRGDDGEEDDEPAWRQQREQWDQGWEEEEEERGGRRLVHSRWAEHTASSSAAVTPRRREMSSVMAMTPGRPRPRQIAVARASVKPSRLSNLGTPAPEVDTRDISELTPMEKVRRVAQSILKSSPAPEPGELSPQRSSSSLLYGLLGLDSGGVDLLAASSPEELAEMLRKEVARRVEDIIAASTPAPEESLPQVQRIASLMRRADAVMQTSDEAVAKAVAAAAAAGVVHEEEEEEAGAGTAEEEDEPVSPSGAAGQEEQVADAQLQGAEPASPPKDKPAGVKAGGKKGSRAKGGGSPTKTTRRHASPSLRPTTRGGWAPLAMTPGSRVSTPGGGRPRPSPPSPYMSLTRSPLYSPPAAKLQVEPQPKSAVRALDMLNVPPVDNWVVRVAGAASGSGRGRASGGGGSDRGPGPRSLPARLSIPGGGDEDWQQRERAAAAAALQQAQQRQRQEAAARLLAQQAAAEARHCRAEAHAARVQERLKQMRPPSSPPGSGADADAQAMERWFVNKGLHYVPLATSSSLQPEDADTEGAFGALATNRPVSPVPSVAEAAAAAAAAFTSPTGASALLQHRGPSPTPQQPPASASAAALSPMSHQAPTLPAPAPRPVLRRPDSDSDARINDATAAALQAGMSLAVLLEVLGHGGGAQRAGSAGGAGAGGGDLHEQLFGMLSQTPHHQHGQQRQQQPWPHAEASSFLMIDLESDPSASRLHSSFELQARRLHGGGSAASPSPSPPSPSPLPATSLSHASLAGLPRSSSQRQQRSFPHQHQQAPPPQHVSRSGSDNGHHGAAAAAAAACTAGPHTYSSVHTAQPALHAEGTRLQVKRQPSVGSLPAEAATHPSPTGVSGSDGSGAAGLGSALSLPPGVTDATSPSGVPSPSGAAGLGGQRNDHSPSSAAAAGGGAAAPRPSAALSVSIPTLPTLGGPGSAPTPTTAEPGVQATLLSLESAYSKFKAMASSAERERAASAAEAEALAHQAALVARMPRQPSVSMDGSGGLGGGGGVGGGRGRPATRPQPPQQQQQQAYQQLQDRRQQQQQQRRRCFGPVSPPSDGCVSGWPPGSPGPASCGASQQHTPNASPQGAAGGAALGWGEMQQPQQPQQHFRRQSGMGEASLSPDSGGEASAAAAAGRRGRRRSVDAAVSSPALLGSPSLGLGGAPGTPGIHSTVGIGVGGAPTMSGGGTLQQHSSVGARPLVATNHATHDWWGFAKQRRHVRLGNGAAVKEALLAGHTALPPQQ